MASIDLSPLTDIDGFMCAAVVDGDSGMLMASTEGGALDLEIAAAGNSEVVKAKRRVAEKLGISGGIEDILITLSEQYHLIRPLAKTQDVFVYQPQAGQSRHGAAQPAVLRADRLALGPATGRTDRHAAAPARARGPFSVAACGCRRRCARSPR